MNFKDNSLSGILRSLVADEFLAWASYYFYEIISQGKALNFTNKIFNENGKDELEDHYHKLVNWMQSNHIPVPTGLSEMQDICNTQYHALQDPSSTTELVDQMIIAEKEAIDAYVQAMKESAVLEYPDLVIMFGEICNDEREHLKNLEDVKSNIDKYNMRISNFSERIRKCFGILPSKYWIRVRIPGEEPDIIGYPNLKLANQELDRISKYFKDQGKILNKDYFIDGPSVRNNFE